MRLQSLDQSPAGAAPPQLEAQSDPSLASEETDKTEKGHSRRHSSLKAEILPLGLETVQLQSQKVATSRQPTAGIHGGTRATAEQV